MIIKVGHCCYAKVTVPETYDDCSLIWYVMMAQAALRVRERRRATESAGETGTCSGDTDDQVRHGNKQHLWNCCSSLGVHGIGLCTLS